MPTVAAQPQTIKRKMLQTFDVPESKYQTVIGISELGANEISGRQSHPGPEGGYVLQGSLILLIDGKAPLHLSAGESYKIALGAPHDVRAGAHGAKVLVTWTVDKGKPFATPTD